MKGQNIHLYGFNYKHKVLVAPQTLLFGLPFLDQTVLIIAARRLKNTFSHSCDARALSYTKHTEPHDTWIWATYCDAAHVEVSSMSLRGLFARSRDLVKQRKRQAG